MSVVGSPGHQLYDCGEALNYPASQGNCIPDDVWDSLEALHGLPLDPVALDRGACRVPPRPPGGGRCCKNLMPPPPRTVQGLAFLSRP
eukprot:3386214-Pyramimonas_sp.AAC.1